MEYMLPKIGMAALPLSHFPTRHQAFIFRASEYISAERIAKILHTTPQNVIEAADEMGVPYRSEDETWMNKGYITIIRRLWHILPYEQLLELLEMDEGSFATILREEDFLDVKLGDKPACDPVYFRPLTDEGMRTAANRIDRAMGAISGVTGENDGTQGAVEQTPDTRPQKPPREKFEPRRGKYRRQGTGSIHQVSKNVWEGRYSPIVNGQRITRNIYAGSIEECEEKLMQMIAEMKEEYGIV